MRRNRDASLLTGVRLMEEIRLKIFGSQDLSIFLIHFLSEGIPFTLVKVHLKFQGLP